MRKKIQVLFILLFTVVIDVKAQDQVGGTSNMLQTIDMFPKSPEAAALSRFVDIPAGNYTGVADFSVPIYTIEFDGQKIPIALRYSTTGIKVDQIATRVGLGWVLDTGPSLSIQVIGNLDNQNYSERPDITYFNPNNALNPQDPIYIFSLRAAGMEQPQFDPEPDIFTYRLLNRSGKYILDRTGAKGVPIPYDQTKIITTYNNHSRMDLIDDLGFQYTFNSYVDNQIVNRNSCVTTISDFHYDDPNYKIQQILSPNNEMVKFIYTPFVANTKYITSIQTQAALSYYSGGSGNPPAIPNTNTKCINYAESKESVLSEIQFKGGKVLFTYSNRTTELRSDLPGDVYLKNVKVINDNGDVIKDFTLHYDYFFSSDSLPTSASPGFMYMSSYIPGLNYRLKLTGVTDGLTLGRYSFEYYESSKLPIRTSNDQDFWGVYNGAGNGDKAIASTETPYYNNGKKYIGANKNPNINYGILGNLKRINYPTGGYTNIEYEADNNGSLTTKIMYEYHTEDEIEEHYYDANYDYTKNPDLTESTFYIPEKATNKTLSFSKNPSDGTYTNPYSCKWHLKNLDTGTEINGTKEISLPNRNDIAGNYRLWMDRGGDYPPQKCRAVYLWDEVTTITTAEPTPIDTITIDTKPIGTIRVKKIESFDQSNGKITREYTYRIPTENHILPYLDSSGIIHGDDYFSSRVERISPSTSSAFGTAVEILLVNNPGWQTSNMNGKPIAYSYVQEHYKDEGHPENSYRKEYVFNNIQDYDIKYSEDNGTSVTWSPGNMENGLLKEEILFNSNNQKVRETYKVYQFDGHFNTKYGSSENNEFSMGYGLKIYPKGRKLFYKDGIPVGYIYTFNYRLYPLRNTWIREDSTRIRNFTNGVDYVESFHFNNYSIPAYKHTYPIESISQNNGNVVSTTFTYPQDKPNQKLIEANMVGIPLETETKKNGKTISKTETVYPTDQIDANTSTSGLPLPKSVSALDLLTGGMSTEVTYNQYDNKGNILQYTTKTGVPTAIIWDKSQTQPIAKVEGATYAQASAVAGDIVTASDQSLVGYTEANLLSKLDAFRNSSALAGFQITTYTYKPLIGVTSITPPSGIREVYIYDTANRLQEVRDAGGRLLKSYEYHYKP